MNRKKMSRYEQKVDRTKRKLRNRKKGRNIEIERDIEI